MNVLDKTKQCRKIVREIAAKYFFTVDRSYTDKLTNGRKVKMVISAAHRENVTFQTEVTNALNAVGINVVKFGELRQPSWNTPNTVTFHVK